MRAYIVAALVGVVSTAFFAHPVYAQKKQQEPTMLQQEDIDKKKAAEAVDKQYNRTMRSTSGNPETVKVDPWANMRGADDSKTKK
jgi:hypothetical protein